MVIVRQRHPGEHRRFDCVDSTAAQRTRPAPARYDLQAATTPSILRDRHVLQHHAGRILTVTYDSTYNTASPAGTNRPRSNWRRLRRRADQLRRKQQRGAACSIRRLPIPTTPSRPAGRAGIRVVGDPARTILDLPPPSRPRAATTETQGQEMAEWLAQTGPTRAARCRCCR